MELLSFNRANCKNCYKCLRSCPVKAIRFRNEQAEIVEERCIFCGRCLVVCPQGARNIRSGLEGIKKAIKNKRKVIASLAPSFAAAFQIRKYGGILTALKRLGFYGVEETAAGADLISLYYSEYMEKGEYENLITTCCPSANYLIEKYFPSLVKYMIPAVSPMIAHGRMIKEAYGRDSFTVFIGPCVAKKYEAVEIQNRGIVDGVLTFEELLQWFKEAGIQIESEDEGIFDNRASMAGRVFPVQGSILSGILEQKGRIPGQIITAHGIEESMEVLSSMEKGDIAGVCLEINICRGGCIGGPGMPYDTGGNYNKAKKVKEFAAISGECIKGQYTWGLDSSILKKSFTGKLIKRKRANQEEITKIMKGMGKHEPADELNCGVCGYNTCREKAQAVFDGMAETSMCLHFMRNKAESLTNLIFAYSPNIIIILDGNLIIKESNPAAERLFRVSAEEIKGKPISVLMDDRDFCRVKADRSKVIWNKIDCPKQGATLMESILYLEKEDIILAIMSDVTAEEKHAKELAAVRENTLNAAQKVIDKQMTVVQEIASLLGETTAETKVILTKLKKVAMGETSDGK